MPDEFLYLEVLPARTAEEAGGFSRAAVRRRGVAVAATLSSAGEFRNFSGTESCRNLAEHIRSARCVVGYNCIAFDYELVRGVIPFRRPKTIDLMVEIGEAAGRRLPFRKACKIAFGRLKIPTAEALATAWSKGEREPVISGLLQRLNALRRLHLRIAERGLSDYEGLAALGSAPAGERTARRVMFDQAAEEFERSGSLPLVAVVRSAGSGAARIVPDIPDGEDGMCQVVGQIPSNRHRV